MDLNPPACEVGIMVTAHPRMGTAQGLVEHTAPQSSVPVSLGAPSVMGPHWLKSQRLLLLIIIIITIIILKIFELKIFLFLNFYRV